ncbi:hypothetical protein C8245_23005 [Paracidovorax avenae]|uniref:hypothetical protein n=1 Tax=Paracidovorax avenae TaxID=80867 RepID=UPI000D206026|nr:hypothetical protein [Paracidovorax avenae]AVS68147.1 hypothetical protein C8245_23005 [Paracidovorax avenae]
MRQDFETERHRCEVRMLIRAYEKPGREWVVAYLNDPKVKGRRAALIADIAEQRERGNVGKEGVWL